MNAKISDPLNVKNRTLFIRDNLDILVNINSESVDLIYLDPPFNSNRHYSAPIGSKAAGASFSDAWTLDDIDIAWHGQLAETHPKLANIIEAAGAVGGKGDKAYLIFMAIRLIELHRILKSTGSIYLHCDPTMSHSLKLLLDGIFGRKNFRNEIIWCYTGPGSPKMRQFNRKHDVIFWYAKSNTWVFNKDNVRTPHADGGPHSGGFNSDMDKDLSASYAEKGKIPETWWNIAIAARSKTQYVGYPTQKPEALLDRIIKASSNEGDVILDPFCGCATALVVAEKLKRQWLGIDISDKAKDLVVQRLVNSRHLFSHNPADLVITRENHLVRSDNQEALVNPKEHKHILYGQQEGYCNGCNYHFPFRNMTLDHIQPVSKGGQDIPENLQLLCGACNSLKGNRLTMAELKAQLKKQRLIN